MTKAFQEKSYAFYARAHGGHDTDTIQAVVHAEINDRVEFCGNPRGLTMIESREGNDYVLIAKGLAQLCTVDNVVSSGPPQVNPERGLMSIQPNSKINPHTVLYEALEGSQQENVLLAEKFFKQAVAFDGSKWNSFAPTLRHADSFSCLRDYAEEALSSGDNEKLKTYLDNTGLNAEHVYSLPVGMARSVAYHVESVGCLPSQAAAQYESDAETLRDAFMSALYAQGGHAMTVDADGADRHPINEDDYMTTVYLQVRGLTSESLSTLKDSRVTKWVRDFPEGAKFSKGGPNADLEEHLLGMGGNELDSPVDHLRIFEVDESTVLVAKLGNDYVDNTITAVVKESLNFSQFLEQDSLPVWLQPVPEHELAALLESLGGKVPSNALEDLRSEDGSPRITAAMVHSENGEITDVFVTEDANHYSKSASFYPVLIDGKAKDRVVAPVVDQEHSL